MNVDSETFFERTFTSYYESEYIPHQRVSPDDRDRFHLSEICGAPIIDQYGIVAAEVAPNKTRIVTNDFRTNEIIVDGMIDTDEFEGVCREFILWASDKYRGK